MPNPLELPSLGGSVIAFVITDGALEYESVAYRFPSLAAVIGALDQLTKPAVVLRGIKSIRMNPLDGKSPNRQNEGC
jgi:hypothetical protein